jgi:hypothetical protein
MYTVYLLRKRKTADRRKHDLRYRIFIVRGVAQQHEKLPCNHQTCPAFDKKNSSLKSNFFLLPSITRSDKEFRNGLSKQAAEIIKPGKREGGRP